MRKTKEEKEREGFGTLPPADSTQLAENKKSTKRSMIRFGGSAAQKDAQVYSD
ncbi:MAG TPA: hypothetical protein VK335_13745 [Bryobacteraceae bacterium]|nr:hypothetical protein [Bryobacteraceae bacterium]